MLVLISYDIEDDRRRLKLAKKLRNFGRRVQKSVFEADIHGDETDKLNKTLGEVELDQNDSIRLYRICADCGRQVKIWGKGGVTKDGDYYIV